MVGNTAVMPVNIYNKYERDANGRISRILLSSDMMGIPMDTAIIIVHYPNATSMDYDYKVNTTNVMGMTSVDSTVNVYTSGKLTTQTSYTMNSLLGSGITSITKIEYTYDALGNVTVMKMHSSAGTINGSIVPIQKQTYTYGSGMN